MGNLVARLYAVPPLYINVYTYAMKRIGVLYDVVGSVNSPYGLVRPAGRDESILGQPVYARLHDLERRER
jgi:RNA-binding protein